jgi:hypothetical protein
VVEGLRERLPRARGPPRVLTRASRSGIRRVACLAIWMSTSAANQSSIAHQLDSLPRCVCWSASVTDGGDGNLPVTTRSRQPQSSPRAGRARGRHDAEASTGPRSARARAARPTAGVARRYQLRAGLEEPLGPVDADPLRVGDRGVAGGCVEAPPEGPGRHARTTRSKPPCGLSEPAPRFPLGEWGRSAPAGAAGRCRLLPGAMANTLFKPVRGCRGLAGPVMNDPYHLAHASAAAPVYRKAPTDDRFFCPCAAALTHGLREARHRRPSGRSANAAP